MILGIIGDRTTAPRDEAILTPRNQRLTFSSMSEQIHGACVDLSGAGVLLRGPSGSGKSDLALRLIDGGASLVADDRVDLEVRDGNLAAHAPGKRRPSSPRFAGPRRTAC